MGLSKLQQQCVGPRSRASKSCSFPSSFPRRALCRSHSFPACAAFRLKKKEKERKHAGSKATAVSATSKAKSQADAQAFICAVCRTAFPVNVRSDALVQHAVNKHPKLPVEQAWPQLAELQAKEASI